MKHACALASLILLCACGERSPEPAEAADVAAARPVAPAIVAPEEIADPAQPPSYEVAVASAAAEHNAAKKRCANQPESVRAECQQEANAAFSSARSDLDRLRGNQP